MIGKREDWHYICTINKSYSKPEHRGKSQIYGEMEAKSMLGEKIIKYLSFIGLKFNRIIENDRNIEMRKNGGK